MLLKDKLAIVTGAAQGIGQAISQEFAKEGASVILVDILQTVHINAENLNKNHPQFYGHTSFICDVSNGEQVNNLFEQIKIHYKDKIPNIIVNNAGIFIDKRLKDTTEDDFTRTIDVNLKSSFLMTKVATNLLIENFPRTTLGKRETYASIINISSLAGQRAYDENACHYSASKAGMEALVRQSAHELGKYKIRCNAICPGVILTPLQTDETRLAKQITMTKLGRGGEAVEVADLCVFLASDKSSYITGTSININGGYFI